MLLRLTSIKNAQVRRYSEHCVYIIILLVLIPLFLYFELCIVLPAVVDQSSIEFYIHLMCATYLLVNIVGNMIYGMFTNTTIRGLNLEEFNKDNWTLCTVCECLRPARSWHCDMCNICVLKRDHHCTYLASCVGYFNQRYFMFFTFHIFIAMVYGFFYNIKYFLLIYTWNQGLILIKFLLPLVWLVLEFDNETVCVFILIINVILASFSGFLFFYHLNNILKGRVVHEMRNYNKDFIYNKGWKFNLIEVFGIKWYLTWISPFIESQLPGNGVEWHVEDKHK